MSVLMISLDNKILEKDSSAQKRHFEYGRICDSLDIVVLGGNAVEGGERDNVRIYGSGGGHKVMRFLKACRLAGKIMRSKKIDLITTQDAAFTGLIGYCLKKKFKPKLNIQIHGSEEKLLNKILFFSIKGKIIKSADSIRVVSERLKRWVVDKYGVDEKRVFKIPIHSQESKGEEISNDKFQISKKIQMSNFKCQKGEEGRDGEEDHFTILTVGRLVKVKNVKLQIEAMADVLKIFPKTELVVVGDGNERKRLEKLTGKLKIQKNVKFTGAGWGQDLIIYYKKADLFVLTSNNEGWGLVIIEAMASGCPVVMTDVGCAGEVVEHEKNGLVIPVNDKKALIAAICKMIANKDKREMFAANGLEAIAGLPSREETLGMYRGMWDITRIYAN